VEKNVPLGLLLHTLHNEIMRYQSQHARESGIDEVSMSNTWILCVLYDKRGHEVFQKDLEVPCGLARSTVTGIVKHMERQGLLLRESVPDDLRLKKLSLTEKGIEVHNRIFRLLEDFEQTLTKGFSDSELDVLAAALQRLQQNLGK